MISNHLKKGNCRGTFRAVPDLPLLGQQPPCGFPPRVAPLARGGAVVDILLAVYFGFALGLLTGCLAGANGDD